jgi:hypothetical protein
MVAFNFISERTVLSKMKLLDRQIDEHDLIHMCLVRALYKERINSRDIVMFLSCDIEVIQIYRLVLTNCARDSALNPFYGLYVATVCRKAKLKLPRVCTPGTVLSRSKFCLTTTVTFSA